MEQEPGLTGLLLEQGGISPAAVLKVAEVALDKLSQVPSGQGVRSSKDRAVYRRAQVWIEILKSWRLILDERNQALKSMIASVINVAKAKGKNWNLWVRPPETIRTSRSFWSSRALIASRSIPVRSSRRPWPSWR